MSEQVTPYRRLRSGRGWALGIGIALVVVAGCAKHEASSDTARPKMAMAADSASAVPEGAVPPQDKYVHDAPYPGLPTPAWPVGQLPAGKTIAYYANGHAKEFADVVHARGWGGWERVRKCKDDASCTQPNGAKADMIVQQMDSASKLSFATGAASELVFARVVNVGRNVDWVYTECAPTSKRRNECYVVVAPNGAAPQRLAMLDMSDPANPTLSVVAFAEPFSACAKPHAPTQTEADFIGCPPADTSASLVAAFATNPGWMSCAEGCCSSKMQ